MTYQTAKSVTVKSRPLLVSGAWLFVGLPIAWGVFNTVKQATQLFDGAPSAPSTAPLTR